MVQVNIVYEGNLRCRAEHEPSGAIITTDAPKDNQGMGASFSPTDLVATALGACMLTIAGIAAKTMQIDMTGTKVIVNKEMTPPPRRIAKLAVVIDVPVKLDEAQKQKFMNAALTCPVHKSLHPDVAVPVEFRWAD